MVRSNVFKEVEQQYFLFIEKKVMDVSSLLVSKRKSFEYGLLVKKDLVNNSYEKELDIVKEEFFEENKKFVKVSSILEDEDDEEEKVDVVGGVKLVFGLYQIFVGIQEEFNSRLENLNMLFVRFLD